MNEIRTHILASVFVCIHIYTHYSVGVWLSFLTQCAYSVLAAGGLIKRLVTLAINLGAILAFCLYS